MEKWDLFDENRRPLNKTHNRQDQMITGEYHIAVEVWTVNSKHEILLTLRHPEKKHYPNFWENTGGSVLAGERSRMGAKRELFEETGITTDEDELFLLGTRREETAFFDTYIVRKDILIADLTMQEGETAAAQWVSIDRLDEMIKTGAVAAPVAERLAPLRKKFEEFLFTRC
ncbi:isopentenyldiphosphate isomerase [Orenia metallireducens]|jgi:isopentenyldiphosphate isomerase|uniref:Isopentenyldiphosphate isomerase n=1 Tax=Orenia metallireducens TaxID=1413210 RepID=A0A285HW55_9FIRM|nr:NUDIX domain-containing protein [Orenia metallireducens]PRX29336.1 isopentenyldiphosphate isomerase [Orenia metallireducens]SNY39962.1 Isopentenyldiphosphate isomerase [Orenia metallireducens]